MKKTEIILPASLLLAGFIWITVSEIINPFGHRSQPDIDLAGFCGDMLFAVVASSVIFIVLRNSRLRSERDSSEKKEQEKEIRKLSLVAQKTSNRVLITGSDGRIEWANEAFTLSSGYSLEEVKGRFPYDVLHGDGTNPLIAAELVAHAAAGQEITRQILHYTKAGVPQWMQVSLSPVSVDGRREYTIAVQTDITQLKLNADKIERQNRQLRQIAFNTSHLVRPPLANILGLTALLKANGCIDRGNEELLGLLAVSAEQLDDVIKKIVLRAVETDEATGSAP